MTLRKGRRWWQVVEAAAMDGKHRRAGSRKLCESDSIHVSSSKPKAKKACNDFVCYVSFEVDVSPEFHPPPVPDGPSCRQICYRHLSPRRWWCLHGAGKRSEPTSAPEVDSFVDIINWATRKAIAISVTVRTAVDLVGVSQATSQSSHRQAMIHLMNG